MKKNYIIETKKILYNIKILKKIINVPIIAVVKCNAYGIGLIEMCNLIKKNDITQFAVTDVNDIIYLRKNNFNEEIIFLNQTIDLNEIKILIKQKAILIVGSFYSALLINKIAKKYNIKIKVYIKLDIGMGRYGFTYNNIDQIKNIIYEMNNIFFLGIFSHFSTAFSLNNKIFKEQIEHLNLFLIKLKSNHLLLKSKIIVANSFIALNSPNLNYSGVRIGSAFIGRTKYKSKLKKVGYLKTYIHEIRVINPGQTIGYGAMFKAKSRLKIAVISLGYFDGFGIIKENIFQNKIQYFIHSMKNFIKTFINNKKYYVYINNKKYLIIGQIGMCHSIINITNSNVNINDKVNVDISPLRINPIIPKLYV